MTDEEYRRKVQGVLANTESYEKADKTAEDLEKLVATQLKMVQHLSLPDEVYQGLFPKIRICLNSTDCQKYIKLVHH